MLALKLMLMMVGTNPVLILRLWFHSVGLLKFDCRRCLDFVDMLAHVRIIWTITDVFVTAKPNACNLKTFCHTVIWIWASFHFPLHDVNMVIALRSHYPPAIHFLYIKVGYCHTSTMVDHHLHPFDSTPGCMTAYSARSIPSPFAIIDWPNYLLVFFYSSRKRFSICCENFR